MKNQIDFSNTSIAFSGKSDKDLIKMNRLFKLMNSNFVTKYGSKLTLLAIKLKLPFVKSIIRNTIFQHFCGGESIVDCQNDIDFLNKYNTLTILDYGAEAKSTQEDFDRVAQENIQAIELAASNTSVPVISIKISGLVDNIILEKLQNNDPLSELENEQFNTLLVRLNSICSKASELSVGVFIDAEESWIQNPLDQIVDKLMEKYNREKVIVYNTYQLYRNDKFDQLVDDHKKALSLGYLLGAKLVRGAYMDKERERARQLNYICPIHLTKKDTDYDFNRAVEYCVKNYASIASCCASHNIESTNLQATLISELNINKKHSHLNFCQLYGMSDNITFNVAKAGFNVAKYLPYGPIEEVIPYLIRRAQENTSVTGEMNKELKYISDEIKRRNL